MSENDFVFVEKISVKDLHNYSQDYILGKMYIRPGQRITHEDISKDVDVVYATGNF
ncbi:MAG: hypothetical protein ACMUEM_00585 [Flavobacteriales bacterium AspAUS03]